MTTTILNKLAAFVRPDRYGLLVTDGRVFCPFSRSDVDVDRCLACAALVTLEEKNGKRSVRCRVIGRVN